MGKTSKIGALGIGAFLAGVTGFVLFNDVLTQHAPVNTGHALSLAALVVALASFHMAGPQLRARAIGSGFALGVLGLAATCYIVISSGSRNAETAQARAAVIESRNSERARALDELARAESELAGDRDAMARECATGRGKNCRGLEEAVRVQEGAVSDARALVASAPPEMRANGGYAQTARVIAAIVGGSEGKIETRLELILPFLVVLIVELGTVTFLHVGLDGHVEAAVSPVPRVELTAEPANDCGAGGGSGEVVSWVREFRARHGRNPQIPELQAQFAVPKTTAWRRIKSA